MSEFCSLIFNMLVPLAPNYTTYVILRFLIGATCDVSQTEP